jgi:hypothetical protein
VRATSLPQGRRTTGPGCLVGLNGRRIGRPGWSDRSEICRGGRPSTSDVLRARLATRPTCLVGPYGRRVGHPSTSDALQGRRGGRPSTSDGLKIRHAGRPSCLAPSHGGRGPRPSTSDGQKICRFDHFPTPRPPFRRERRFQSIRNGREIPLPTHQKPSNYMASNEIPSTYTSIVALAEDAADGAMTHGL